MMPHCIELLSFEPHLPCTQSTATRPRPPKPQPAFAASPVVVFVVSWRSMADACVAQIQLYWMTLHLPKFQEASAYSQHDNTEGTIPLPDRSVHSKQHV